MAVLRGEARHRSHALRFATVSAGLARRDGDASGVGYRDARPAQRFGPALCRQRQTKARCGKCYAG
ncbi:hypothetical protein [Musicola keenii]|uniref:hypothetical protein n=1 Tax=Musicola keenii TaxID=2884250 RepID=UPI001781DA28|nr:hypothetical protein [Musicola keenii]